MTLISTLDPLRLAVGCVGLFVDRDSTEPQSVELDYRVGQFILSVKRPEAEWTR